MLKPSNPGTRFDNMVARDKGRLFDPDTRLFLHLAANGPTPDLGHSWLGTRAQANRLAQLAANRGESFPYGWYHRDHFDGDQIGILALDGPAPPDEMVA